MMLTFSCLVAIYGVIAEYWFFKDYWRPILFLKPSWQFGGFEDLVFGFAIGGIVSCLYEIVFKKQIEVFPIDKDKTILRVILFPVFIFGLMYILTNLLHLNSIFSNTFGLLMYTLGVLTIRKDLIRPSIISGLLLALLMFAIYFLYLPYFLSRIMDAWLIHQSSVGVLIFGRVPLTEMIWAFSFGLAGSCGSKYQLGYRHKISRLAS